MATSLFLIITFQYEKKNSFFKHLTCSHVIMTKNKHLFPSVTLIEVAMQRRPHIFLPRTPRLEGERERERGESPWLELPF